MKANRQQIKGRGTKQGIINNDIDIQVKGIMIIQRQQYQRNEQVVEVNKIIKGMNKKQMNEIKHKNRFYGLIELR